MRFDARSAFPEGPEAFIAVVRVIVVLCALTVFVVVSPLWLEVGAAEGFFAVVALSMIATRLLPGTRFAKPLQRKLRVAVTWLPPAWIAFCAFRSTRSWLWTVVAYVVGGAVWELVIYLAKRRVRIRTVAQRQRPRAAQKSRQRPSVR